MLEDQVTYLLQRYLGNYVRGLNREALKISVWRGDVELSNMQLKPEALAALKLPVKVKAGFLGSVKLKVPWSRLGQEPVVVYLDQIFILAEPTKQVQSSSEDAIQEAKRSRVREIETKLLESWEQHKSETNTSWLGSLVNTIIGNLKLSISNVHIRYEDHDSNPGHPFAAGVTLHKLSAVTVDDFGRETFATGGALDRVQKTVELERLAVYFDSNICPWKVEKSWDDLLPSEWIQVFEMGNKNAEALESPNVHNYLLQPVSGSARYVKLQSNESKNMGQPLQKATVNLDDVTLCLSKDAYTDMLKFGDFITSFNKRLKYAHYRPTVLVKENPRAWWKYSYRVVVDEVKKASGKFSWDQVLRYAKLRKRYVTLYASLLKPEIDRAAIEDNKDIQDLDRELDIEVIIQWRMLAHKVLQQTAESDAYLNQQKAGSSWWSLGWGSSGKDESSPRSLTEEDWERLNKIIGYKEGSDEQFPTTHERGDLLLSVFEIHMKHNASKLVVDGKECLADLSCDGMEFSINLYPEAKIFDFKLGSYRLLSPNGLLAESATTADSLSGVFSYKPLGAQLDWTFVAKASPCYMTYLKESIDQIVLFFKSTAISQSMALETVAAVQVTLDGVRRSAQQRATRALKERSRFTLDLDIAAPKITIPSEYCPDNVHATKLLLDLGNLMLSTQDYWESDSSDEKDRYLQFSMVLSDVSAFLVDGDYSWGQTALGSSSSALESSNRFLPVLDRCTIVLKLQQMQLETPFYPSSRLSLRLPSLGFHFSPARYHRLMQVAKIFQDEDNFSSDMISPWSQADFEGWAFLLSWKGVGNREAIWQRRYLLLVGPFLYVLESPSSKVYKQYFSLRGKQVNQVPPEFSGNEDNVLAVHETPHLNSKVVEGLNTVVLRFDTEDSCKTWQNRLHGAIYRASGSSAIANFSGSASSVGLVQSESSEFNGLPELLNAEKLFITGVLDELKICFTCNYKSNQDLSAILLGRENRLFEFRAIGGQVELLIRGNDMFIGTLLRSLEIEDHFKRNSGMSPRYLARSFIESTDTSSIIPLVSSERQKSGEGELSRFDSEEQFFEATENLSEVAESPSQVQASSPASIHGDVSFAPDKLSVNPPSFSRIAGLLPDAKLQINEMDSEKTGTLDSFVKAQVVFLQQDSPLYSNIDKHVAISLATLSFFCHRPTVLSILAFVNAINFSDTKLESHGDNSSIAHTKSSKDDAYGDVFETEESAVKGLLGKGKARILFYLTLNMSTAQIFLVNEDGACLVTLSQNNLIGDIKVFPSSFSVKAALGNLRISDDSLPSSHSYYWICDMRNPGGSSFVELDFSSYSTDDDDFCGYDYSLTGQLSEVRIIYLNRFIQEIVGYFMGLVPSNSESFVKLKDQVSNSEMLFTTNEIEGSPAVKLDVSLTKPIIVMPRRTDSLEYLEVDVHYISVRNSFEWVGGDKSEMNAIHLETMTIEVKEINLIVGTGEISGENIIEDVKGLSVVIQRSLRDLLHQIPVTEAVIKVEELRAALSNREYHIITECSLSNISEAPHLVPALDLDFGAPSGEIDQSGGSVILNPSASVPQDIEAWITIKVSVSINLIELCLHSGSTRELPLATVQVSGAWFLFKSDSFNKSFIWATLKGFAVIDEREGTKEEFRHAIGKHESIGRFPLDYGFPVEKHECAEKHDTKSILTMLILDAKFTESSASISLCIQRPHLLVALDFLLAIAEFFVPTLRDLLSDDGLEDPLKENGAIILDNPVYTQPLTEFSLSPKTPFIIDDERFDHYIYDGKGGNLYLKDGQGNNLSHDSFKTLIFIGNGKTLRFKNVVIKNGKFLDSCIFLGSNSSYLASMVDDVIIGEDLTNLITTNERARTGESPQLTVNQSVGMEYLIDLQAIGPELTFYNTSKDVGESLLMSNKLLHAEMDVLCSLKMSGENTEITGNLCGLKVECNGIRVLEPFDAEVKFSNISGRTKIIFSGSDVLMNFSFSILRLFLAIQEDILTFVRMTSKKISVTCSQFDKVATIQYKKGPSYSFWRPCAPPGFAILGDCLTPSNKPPSSGVLAVNTSFIKVRRPISFKQIWPPLRADAIGDDCASTSYSGCSIWFPQAPHGYLSMGCVVSAGRNEPPLSSSFCILASLVCPCSFRDCIYLNIDELDVSLAFWRVRNSFGSFLPTYPSNTKVNGKAYELRQLRIQNLDKFTNSVCLDSHGNCRVHDNDQLQRPPLSPSQMFEAVASFKLIWWNQGAPNQKKLSIWRPILSSGTIYFGDVAVQGYEPPNTCYVLRNSGDESLVKPPLDFQLVAKINKYKRIESICMWLPQAPPGYVSLGCIASKGSPKLDDFSSLRCVRSDMVTGDQFPEESIWDTRDTKISKESFSMWSIGNEVGTFVVRRGFKKPPKRYALVLTHQSVSSSLDNIVIDAKINVLSAAVYDDYGGLMVPLFNISLSSIGFNLHGRPDYLNSNVNFSLNGRSYNDKYDAWEPIIEPVDAFLRYQYDVNSPGANSQLRMTSTGDLNLNVSTSNINTILQAYSSWNNLGQVHKSYKNKEMQPTLYGGVSDVHHKTNYHIIPQNKLGQDVFVRDTEVNKYSIIFTMPSGDNKPIKVPVSKNLLNSHLEGKTSRLSRLMVPVVISCAELPAGRGLSKSQYIVIVRLLLNQPNMSPSDQQRARTCGAIPEKDSSSGALVVKWDEIFFFKVDIPEHYVLEFVVVDLGNGQPIGLHSAPLCEIAYKLAPCSESCGNRSGSFRPLSAINSTRDHTIQGDKNPKDKGRIKFAVFLPSENESDEQRISSSKPGFIQISPARDGPWTTVRLNYATHAACWRFGNDVVASELTVTNGTRYVNIRSLVSVINNTDFLMDVCLKSKRSIETLNSTNNSDEHIDEDVGGCIYETDENFEIEKFMPSIGWSSDSSGPPLAHKHASHSSSGGGCELSDGWEYIDEWQIDKSLISDNDGWVYAPDVEHLNWPDTYSEMNLINHARQRRWVRHRKYFFGIEGYVPLCSLKPGDTIPLPLPVLVHPTLSYYLKLKPNRSHGAEYSWTSVRMEHAKAEVADNVEEFSEICVSDLCESEKILYASQVDRSSSTSSSDLWFSLGIKAIEVGKDIHSDPIQDWKLKVDCALSITNYLPLPTEYSICSKQSSGEFITISHRLFAPGETFKFYNTNLHEPLYISLLIRGWDMMHGPALISHPSKFPSKAAILRSSYSGRVAQVIFDQSQDKEQLTTRRISVYAPCWISSDRCPALLYRLLNASDGKERKSLLSLETGKNSEKIFWEITEEEFYEGCTIASAINFKSFGLSLSIEEPGSENFGPIRNLAPLGDLDGSFDIYASGANSNCFRLFVTSKTCPYSLIPTKVISIRPHMTFTNRIGQDIFLKQSVNDQTNVLHASDSRASFIYHDVGVPERLQVKLEDTDWSFPIEIIEEDTLTLMLKNYNGCRSFLRLEIRGYEEGSRFLVVFRLESSDGPLRIENRIEDKTIGIRQSGSEDDSWIQINSLSSTPFSWVNPYGQRCVDLFISNETNHTIQCISLEKNCECSRELKALGVQHDVIEVGGTRIVRFSVLKDTSVKSEITLDGKTSASSMPNEAGNSTMELIMELGILGISLIDHKPRELLFLFLERVFISYSTGYAGNTCRFKLIMGQVQLDNQLPLTVMPVLLAPDRFVDIGHPVFKTTITMNNENKDGTQVYPYIYVRVMDKKWRINIHEPIIWALMDFYNNLHLERLSDGSDVAQVDPEIRIDLIDVSEVRLKLALETAPTQRPIGVLGIWSPILSAIGNALKIQIHLRKIVHRNKFTRKSSILPSILNHVKRDLIHDPLHLIFSVDVLGITKSTFASLSRGFAELSTDGQFLELRSKQVWSRRITGVRDGFLQGTEALAQGVAFGVSGVVTKPVESARQYGFLGLVHGFGRAFLGFVVQPVSGALDFVSLTVDGISTSFGRCLELLSNKAAVQRIRNPRAICASGVLKEYSEREASGQMILYLAEASRHLGCTDLFKEPSKFARSDYYEDHFVIPYNRVLLITNKHVMLLQSLAPERLDKQPCKIIWDVPWEELMALELAKAGFPKPSHLIIHLKNFRRSECFVRLVKCSTEEEDNEEPQAVRICVAVRRMWKVYQAASKTLTLKVPSSQRQVHFICDVADREDSFRNKLMLKPRELRLSHAITKTKRFTNHSVNFQKIWSSEQEPRRRCTLLCPKQVSDDSLLCSIWRPVCPEGYVSVGDTVRQGMHPPTVATIYRESEGIFASPVGYDLVWRNCYEDYATPLSVWHPRAPEGFVSLGCVGVPGYDEPYLNSAYCISSEITEETLLEDQAVWTAPESYPWACYFYQVQSEALQFVALRQRKEETDWRPMRVSEQKLKQLLESKGLLYDQTEHIGTSLNA